MDYPPPMVTLNSKNEITQYCINEIGDWDKLSIQYGYEQFPQETNETAALDKLLTDASKNTTFISDRDARDPGGMHPNAHLWDNGKDPVTELKRNEGSSKKRYLEKTTSQRHTNGNA
jgi:hypothetical protein